MELVTAAYATGATGFGFLFTAWIDDTGVLDVISLMAIIMAATSVLTALAIKFSRVLIEADTSTEWVSLGYKHDTVRICLYWLAYGDAVMVGLLTLGYVAEIAAVSSGNPSIKKTAIGTTGAVNALGGILAGLLADRVAIRVQLFWRAVSLYCWFVGPIQPKKRASAIS